MCPPAGSAPLSPIWATWCRGPSIERAYGSLATSLDVVKFAALSVVDLPPPANVELANFILTEEITITDDRPPLTKLLQKSGEGDILGAQGPFPLQRRSEPIS